MSCEVIAIIDDDPDQQSLIAETLQDYIVQTFSTASAFFSAYQASTPPNLLLCDIQMDGIDGYETCRQVRKHPLLNPIPIVLISGLADQANFIEAVEAGANEYISKPFRVLELRDLIEKQLILTKRQP